MIGSTPFQYRAVEAGLTEPLVCEVILSFYEKVRVDEVLGPVFTEAIGNDWTAHTERIILFWLTATRLGRGYDSTGFLPAHLRNLSIRSDQLPRWLQLFGETARELCSPQAASVLIEIAERMAETIRISLDRRDGR
jgi:hemoglobin